MKHTRTTTKRVLSVFLAVLMVALSLPMAFGATTHTVTYYSRHGQIYFYGWNESYWPEESVNVAEGAAIDLTLDLTVGDWDFGVSNDWTFLGWNTDSSATTALTSLKMGTSDVELYPVYKKDVTATFIDYNGATRTTRTVIGTAYNGRGAVITKPTRNVMTGWTKGGWVEYTTAPNGDDSVISADPSRMGEENLGENQVRISSDKTYYGLYYRYLTISYNANGGSPTPENQSTQQFVNSYDITVLGASTAHLAAAPTKAGATFAGWTMGSPSGTKYAAGESITISENTTMYATWINDEPTTHTVTYNYPTNGGTSATKTSATVAEGSAIDLTPTATKSGWTFVGWNTNANATTALSSLNMGTSNVTLYAIFKKTLTGTFIDYSGTTKKTTTKTVDIYNNATSGTLTAPTQNTYTGWTSRGWATGTAADASAVSSFTVSANTTYYGLYQRTLTLSYNANGGSSTPSSQTGTQYANSYGISSTKNPTLKLANAISKSGSTFDGWAMGSASGTKYAAGANVTISANTTMYATWKVNVNIYNIGEESYSFRNYVDDHATNGHCFGMAVTSSGYYMGALSKTVFGGQDSDILYSYADAPEIRKPICHYLHNQGPDAEYPSMVAGGRIDLDDTIDWNNMTYSGLKNIARQDWNDCVNYVKNHAFDNKGSLNIGMYYLSGGGHATNFLYYKEVNGQQRIYAYDNNVPWYEVYYYLGSDGYIHEDSDETFTSEWTWLYDAIKGESIIGFDLMDVNKYFQLAPRFNLKQYVYAEDGEIVVEGAEKHRMKCGTDSEQLVMFKIPSGVGKVSVKPLVKNADFQYNGTSYSFGEINEKTKGTLTVMSKTSSEGLKTTFTIENAPTDNPTTPTEPSKPTVNPNACKYCGKEHTGLFGWLVKLFHNILFSIFGAKK